MNVPEGLLLVVAIGSPSWSPDGFMVAAALNRNDHRLSVIFTRLAVVTMS